MPSFLDVHVRDAVTGAPIRGAEALVQPRVVEALPGGEGRLLPLEPGEVVGHAETDANGLASVLMYGDEGWFAVTVLAPGYVGQVNTMVRWNPHFPELLSFALIPSDLKTGTREKLADDAINSPKAEEEQWIVPHSTGGDLHALATLVPDEIRVENLNGFTGLMNFDEFVAGVVSRELGDSFPIEALKAQAVASRSFALEQHQRLGRANGGQAYTATVGALSRNAALATTKIVLTVDGRVIRAYFSARCNGDYTLNSEEAPTLANCRVGGLGAGVVSFARARPCSGHINCSQTAEQCCVLTVRGKTNYIYGHGIGMCQRGAQQFAARDRWTYERILTNFYTGVNLQTPAPPAREPQVTTLSPMNVTTTNAVLYAAIQSAGSSPVVERAFAWGTGESLTNVVPNARIEVEGSTYFALLTGLIPGTTYSVQARARNAEGWGRGEIVEFQTAPGPPTFSRAILAGSEIQIELQASASRPFRIESSTNLTSWAAFTNIATDAAGAATIRAPATLGERMFFRAVSVD